MFEASPTLKRPPRSTQVLWRYLSADRLRDFLATGELFFAHLPALEDAREGALTARTREHMANWFQLHESMPRIEAYREVDEYNLKAQQWFYVNCWHMNDHESYLMWKAYGGRGFALVTTFERLQASLDATSAVITGGVVDYVDFERDSTALGNVFHHVAMKDLPYTDEREFRLVFWSIDPRNADQPKLQNGVRIKADIRMLVRNIVRSPYPEPIDPELESLLERHRLDFASSAVLPRTQ